MNAHDPITIGKIGDIFAHRGTGREIKTADNEAGIRAILETMPGWSGTTFGARTWDALPPEARAYLHRIEEICEVSIDVISTGPERDETILKRHPFGA